jgi:nuclear pore complex protein Nup205
MFQTELEEVEARSEEFPLSRALVTLLLALTETAELPLLLGVGRRTPGLSPYLYFVLDCFLLKFHQRAYRRQEEKVKIGFFFF